MMGTSKRKGTQMTVREFDEDRSDGDCIRFHIAVIWEANQAMADAIEARDNHIDCLAWKKDEGRTSITPGIRHGFFSTGPGHSRSCQSS
jgi:hypothetical protein